MASALVSRETIALADSALAIAVAPDAGPPGEALAPGLGGSLRDGMGQSQATLAEGAVEIAVLGGVLFDDQGARRADLGIAQGKIQAVGRAGNPDIQPAIAIPIGPATQIVDARGLIVTPAAIDALARIEAADLGATRDAGVGALHVLPSAAPLGRDPFGPGPIDARATAWSRLPCHASLHAGFWAQGSSSRAAPLIEQLEAGACGLFVDAARGAAPATLARAAAIAAETATPLAVRLDPFDEFGELDAHLDALDDTPALIVATRVDDHRILARPHLALAVSTRPPLLDPWADPRTQARLDRDAAAAQIALDRGEALAAYGDGAPEALWRDAFRTADAIQRAEGGDADARARRFLAAITSGPAAAIGLGADSARLEARADADLVLWRPELFAIAPEGVVLRGGQGLELRAPDQGAARLARLMGPGRARRHVRAIPPPARPDAEPTPYPETPLFSRAFAP